MDSLPDALADQTAFSLTLSGVGAFPSPRRPRAIWLGVTEGAQALTALAERAEQAAVALGFAPEKRPFQAHLTLGRVKAPTAPPELVRALEGAHDAVVGQMRVGEVVLMQSELRRTGPIYTPVAVFRLKEAHA